MLERVAVLAVLTTTGCGLDASAFVPPACETTAGLRLYVPAGMTADCDGLQHAETLAVAAFTQYAHWVDPAAELGGWRVKIVDPSRLNENAAYEGPYGAGRISGQTFCGFGFADVNTQDWYGSSSLIHEMAHMIERCVDPEHTTWAVRGVSDAINAARREGWGAVAVIGQ